MNNNKLKEIYEANPDDWVVYAKWEHKSKCIYKQVRFDDSSPFIGCHLDNASFIYLIAKQHEHIADAVIANPDVEVEIVTAEDVVTGELHYETIQNFIENYNHRNIYRLKETKPKIKQVCDNPDVIGYCQVGVIKYNEPTQINSTKDEPTYKEHKEARGEEDGSKSISKSHSRPIAMGINMEDSLRNETISITDDNGKGEEEAITDSRNDICNNGNSDSLEADMEIADDNGKVYESILEIKADLEIDGHTKRGVYNAIALLDEFIKNYNLKPIKKELTLNEILQDVQDKKMSVHASELLIKAQFGIKQWW